MTGVDSGVYGAELSAISIIVVYHLFSIQTWLQISLTMESEIESIRSASVQGDMIRSDARTRAAAQLRRFPMLTVGILSVCLALLGTIAIVAGAQLHRVKLVFTAGPVLILLATFAASTFASYLQGRKALNEALLDL